MNRPRFTVSQRRQMLTAGVIVVLGFALFYLALRWPFR